MKASLFSFLSISKQNLWKSLAILIIGLVLTTIATKFSVYEAETDADKEFELLCNEIRAVVAGRLHAHAGFLRSGAALFETADSITRHDWQTFYDHSSITKNLPGIQGIGYAMIIPKSQLEQHNQSVRSEGFPTYHIFPAGDRAIYTSIIYLEPFEGDNLRAFGYDMFSEPVRRKAMELSRDSNLAVLSGKVILVQETDNDAQAGTLMYVPVYRQDMPINTVEQRRAAIKGWVYSPNRMSDLMRGILGRWDLYQQKRIRLQVFDNDTLSTKALLYDSQKNDTLANSTSLSRKFALPIHFNGRPWMLKFTQADPQNLYLQGEALTVMLSGMVMSLLLFSLSYSLFNTRYRAKRIAEKLTGELKESEEKYRTDFVLLQTIVASPVSIIIFALDTNYCYLSFTKFHKITMKHIWAADIALGMNMLSIIHNSEDKKRAKQNFDRAFSGEKFVLSEEYGDNALSRNYYENYYSPIKDAEGTIIGVSVFVVDITERKKAEELYQLLANHVDDFVWLMDLNLKITYQSPSVEKKRGFTDRELIEMPLDKNLTPESLERALVLMQAEMPKFFAQADYDTTYTIELEFYCKDGSTIWCECKFGVIRNESGVPVSIIGEGRDITQRKQAEEKLIEKEASLRYAQQIAKMGSWEYDIHTQKTNFSENYYNFFGFNPAEVVPSLEVFQNAIHPDDLSYFNDIVARVYAEKKQISFELRVIAKDNKVKWIFNEVLPETKDGVLVKLFGAFIDITERKQWEENLKEQSRFANSLIDLNPEIIYIYDIVDYKNVYINNGIVSILGYSVDDMHQMLNKVLPLTMHPDDYNIYLHETSPKYATLKDGEHLKTQYRLKSKAGKWHWFDCDEIIYKRNPDESPLHIFGVCHDMTERKQTEEALMAWNERFKKLSANAPGLIYQFTRRPDGSYYVPIASEGIRDIFGCTPEDVVDNFTAIGNVLYPEDAERVINDIEYSAKHLSAFTCEFRVQIPGKPIQWIYSKSNPEKLADGSITWYGFNTDITDHKQAEEKISMLAHAIRSISECVSITDMDDNIIFVNRALLQTYNYEESELIGKHISIVRSPNNPSDIVQQILPSTLKGGWNGELLNIRKDGTEFPVFVSTSAICDEIGNPIALIGIGRDITDSKQAEMILRESKDHFHAIFENNAAAIVIIEPDTTISLVNNAYCQMCGFTKEEVIGISWTTQIHPEDLERLKEYNRQRLTETGQAPQKYDFRFFHKSGEVKHVLASVAMIEKPKKIIVSFVDIHDRKIAEQDMLEKNEELSNYLRIIAHDLRSPLVGVQGYALRYGTQTETLKTILANTHLDAADKEIVDKITFEDMPKSLNAILDSVDKMDMLLKGLSKISNTGRDKLIIKKINMNQFFNAIVSTHHFQM